MRVRTIKIINNLDIDVRITAQAVFRVLDDKVGYINEKDFGENYWNEEAEAELIIEIEEEKEGEQ